MTAPVGEAEPTGISSRLDQAARALAVTSAELQDLARQLREQNFGEENRRHG